MAQIAVPAALYSTMCTLQKPREDALYPHDFFLIDQSIKNRLPFFKERSVAQDRNGTRAPEGAR